MCDGLVRFLSVVKALRHLVSAAGLGGIGRPALLPFPSPPALAAETKEEEAEEGGSIGLVEGIYVLLAELCALRALGPVDSVGSIRPEGLRRAELEIRAQLPALDRVGRSALAQSLCGLRPLPLVIDGTGASAGVRQAIRHATWEVLWASIWGQQEREGAGFLTPEDAMALAVPGSSSVAELLSRVLLAKAAAEHLRARGMVSRAASVLGEMERMSLPGELANWLAGQSESRLVVQVKEAMARGPAAAMEVLLHKLTREETTSLLKAAARHSEGAEETAVPDAAALDDEMLFLIDTKGNFGKDWQEGSSEDEDSGAGLDLEALPDEGDQGGKLSDSDDLE